MSQQYWLSLAMVAALLAPFVYASLKYRFAKIVDHVTVDGGVSAPYPGMTDEDLYDFETGIGLEPHERTWPTLEDFLTRKTWKDK